jgi:hypothetical protein
MAKSTPKKAIKIKKAGQKVAKPISQSQQGTLLSSDAINQPFEGKKIIPVNEESVEKTDDNIIGNKVELAKGDQTWNSFYLQLKRGNILNIFSRGIILPSNYVPNRPFIDIQSRFSNNILISKGIIDDLQEDDALLEVFLNNDEIKIDLKENEQRNYFFVPAIPISRIKTIFVIDLEAKDKLIADSKVSDAGIIPESIIVTSFPPRLQSLSSELNPPIYNDPLDEKINSYDSILGCLAYNRSSDLFFIDKLKAISSHSDHFWAALAAITRIEFPIVIKGELIKYYQQLFNISRENIAPLNQWLFYRINDKKSFLDKDTVEFEKIFNRQVNDKEQIGFANMIFQKMMSSIERRKTYLILQETKSKDISFLRLFYFLREYGNFNSEDRVTARKEIPEKVDAQYAPFIFSLLGYFFGYTFLRTNDEKVSSLSDKITNFLNQLSPPTIKFGLNNPIDYLTIESVYKYAFTGTQLDHIPTYIKAFSFPQKKLDFAAFDRKDFQIYETSFLGVEVFKLEEKNAEKDLLDQILKSLNNIPDEIPLVSDLGYYCFRNKLEFKLDLNRLMKIQNSFRDIIKGIAFFKKETIHLSILSKKVDLAEFKSRLDSSIQHNDF